MTNENHTRSQKQSDSLEKLRSSQNRKLFEKWLLEEYYLEGTWNSERNCYDEFACHMAFQGFLAGLEEGRKPFSKPLWDYEDE